MLRVNAALRRVECRSGARRRPERGEARPLDLPPPAATKTAPPRAFQAGSVERPTSSGRRSGKVIAGFAEPRSKGIDIDGKLGDPVIAAAAGRVTYIGTGIPGLGKLVVIKHDNGFITVYAHNKDILVKEQQAVTRGQKIAEVGNHRRRPAEAALPDPQGSARGRPDALLALALRFRGRLRRLGRLRAAPAPGR